MSEIDMKGYDAGFSSLGADVAAKLGQGADEVYARLREDDHHDVITKSNEQTKPENVAGFINPAVPLLAPPQINAADISGLDQAKTAAISSAHSSHSTAASGSSFSLQANDQLEGTMRGVLDSWQESTAKYVKASKEHNEESKVQQEKLDSQRWVQDVYNLGQVQAPHSTAASAVMAAGLTGVMAGNKIDPSDPQHLVFNANQNGIQAATPMIPSDMRAELGLLGALLMTPAGFQATALTIGKSEQTQGQQVSKDFAHNYGDRMLNMVNDKGFTGWLQTIIQAKAPGDSPVSKEQLGEWTAGFKLGMLMSAYAVDYKAQYGGVSGKEVLGEMKNLSLLDAGARAPLLDAIRQQYAALSPGMQKLVEERLGNWLDSSPKLDALMDPIKIYSALSAEGQATQQARGTHTPI